MLHSRADIRRYRAHRKFLVHSSGSRSVAGRSSSPACPAIQPFLALEKIKRLTGGVVALWAGPANAPPAGAAILVSKIKPVDSPQETCRSSVKANRAGLPWYRAAPASRRAGGLTRQARWLTHPL